MLRRVKIAFYYCISPLLYWCIKIESYYKHQKTNNNTTSIKILYKNVCNTFFAKYILAIQLFTLLKGCNKTNFHLQLDFDILLKLSSAYAYHIVPIPNEMFISNYQSKKFKEILALFGTLPLKKAFGKYLKYIMIESIKQLIYISNT